MQGLTVGVHILSGHAKGLVDGIVAAEAAGIEVAWMTSGGVAADPLAVFSAAAVKTERIQFGTCILPTFPRHPLAMVQGAVTVDSLAPGRLRLGIGPSHKPSVEGTYGIPFVRPLEHLREYLTILRAILGEGSVQFSGKRLTANARIAGVVDCADAQCHSRSERLAYSPSCCTPPRPDAGHASCLPTSASAPQIAAGSSGVRSLG